MALWRIRATVDDRPGYLSVLTASLALRGVNILAVQVHTTEAGAVDDFLVDAPDTMTEAELLAAVERGRGREAFIARAEAQGLADQPTRALALAGRLVHDPDALGDALATLLDAGEVTWRPTAPATAQGFTDTRMWLADPGGGRYDVSRTAPAFTPAEYARAQALVEVAGAALRQHAEHATVLLPDGAELLLRPATADDVTAARGLHERSSAQTLHRRYLGGAPPSDARLRRLLEPAGGVTLVAVRDDGSLVAMANLVVEGDLGEVALLVEDDWQRRGIGTALLRRLAVHAARRGLTVLTAHTGADDAAVVGALRRLGPARTSPPDGGLVSVELPVTGDLPAGTPRLSP
jgi:GNAT superfamily N-acetyltransferase